MWWSVNLACNDLNCSYCRELKLRKLVINNWVYVFPRLVSGGDGEQVVGRWNDIYIPVWGIFVGRFKCRKLEGGALKEEFCGTLHVGWSDRNCSIHLGGILYMLDWIFSQNCRNSLPLHTAVQLARSTKSSKLSYLTKCLQSTPSSVLYQIEEYKNISLVAILHCLNSFKSTLQLCGIFIIHIYCLGKTTT